VNPVLDTLAMQLNAFNVFGIIFYFN
jgi:hypothetical protein